MKINNAYTTLEGLLENSDRKTNRRIYSQLLGALNNLRQRDLSKDELESVEAAIDDLRLQDTAGMKVKELRSRSNQFRKDVQKTLSLVPENHYMALGMAFGVASGGVVSAVLQGFAGMPQSGTGLGIGIGLTAGFMIGTYLDIEAGKQNRVLTTRTR